MHNHPKWYGKNLGGNGVKTLKLMRTIMLGLIGGISGSCLSYRAWFAFALSIALLIVMLVYSFMVDSGEAEE